MQFFPKWVPLQVNSSSSFTLVLQYLSSLSVPPRCTQYGTSLANRLVSSMHTTCMYMLFIFCARILLLYNYSSSCLAFFSLYSSILVSWFANDGLPDGELNKSAVYGDYCKAETITDMLSCFIPILFCNSKHFNKFAMYYLSDRSCLVHKLDETCF